MGFQIVFLWLSFFSIFNEMVNWWCCLEKGEEKKSLIYAHKAYTRDTKLEIEFQIFIDEYWIDRWTVEKKLRKWLWNFYFHIERRNGLASQATYL